jgi:hypothetical protein
MESGSAQSREQASRRAAKERNDAMTEKEDDA